MFDLFWSVFNLALLVSFVYFFFSVIRIGLRQLPDRQRLFAAPVLTIGIIALLAGRSGGLVESNTVIDRESSVDRKTVNLSVVNNLEVRVVRRVSDGGIDPLLSNSEISGFVFGRKWKHLGTSEKNGQLFVFGQMNYNILGWEIMSFSKELVL